MRTQKIIRYSLIFASATFFSWLLFQAASYVFIGRGIRDDGRVLVAFLFTVFLGFCAGFPSLWEKE